MKNSITGQLFIWEQKIIDLFQETRRTSKKWKIYRN